MLDRLGAPLGRLHRDPQLADQRLLADVLLEALRPQRVVEAILILALRLGGDDAFSGHGDSIGDGGRGDKDG